MTDFPLFQLKQKQNVQLYPGFCLSVNELMKFGCIATGSRWRADGVSRLHVVPMPIKKQLPLFTPDDLMARRVPSGTFVVFDDDHSSMGGVLADLCAIKGRGMTLVTPPAFLPTLSLYRRAEWKPSAPTPTRVGF